MGDPEFDNNRRAEILGKEGGESCGWRSAFLGTGCFLKAFRPLVSGIPTMVWVLTEGQRHDRIPHPEPREQAAAELPRNRRPALPETILPSEGMKAALLEKAILQRPRPLGRKLCIAGSQ